MKIAEDKFLPIADAYRPKLLGPDKVVNDFVIGSSLVSCS